MNYVQRPCCDLQLGRTITIPGYLDEPGRIVLLEFTEGEDIKVCCVKVSGGAYPGQLFCHTLPWHHLVNDHTQWRGPPRRTEETVGG